VTGDPGPADDRWKKRLVTISTLAIASTVLALSALSYVIWR
jgi:hypothetical protein